MGLSLEKLEQEWRKELLSHATGNILEVGVGIGDNFKYYPKGVNVTATDMSERVIEIARKEAKERGVSAEFIASSFEPFNIGNKKFDTIVSTFSLSAYNDPLQILKQFNNYCKPDGTILLLEYGLSKYQLINWIQRKINAHHYRKTGSHINIDMLGLITESNLGVKKIEVKYAGIVYLAWAYLKPTILKEIENSGLKNTG